MEPPPSLYVYWPHAHSVRAREDTIFCTNLVKYRSLIANVSIIFAKCQHSDALYNVLVFQKQKGDVKSKAAFRTRIK